MSAVDELIRLGSATVVLFTADASHPQVPTAMRHGAVTTITKDTPPAEMRSIIRAAANGEALAPGRPEQRILTDRQLEVLRLVSAGMTNGEIADELGLAVTTVKAYWQETMQRLGVRNRAEAIVAGYRAGLL